MSDLDSNSSYESYSSDSGSSKSLPTPCELVLKRNIINQCEEIKNKFEKEQTGSAVVNNEFENCNQQVDSYLSAQENSGQKQELSIENTNSIANNDDAQENSGQKQESSTENYTYSISNNDVAQIMNYTSSALLSTNLRIAVVVTAIPSFFI